MDGRKKGMAIKTVCLWLLWAVCIVAEVKGDNRTVIVALLPAEGNFLTVLDGLRGELGEKYRIDVVDMKKPPSVKELGASFRSANGSALVLMDSKAVALARELQASDSSFNAVPKFVVMTLMAELTARGLQSVAGIKFEVPGYTLITNFHIISQNDFSRVGVFYREQFKESVEEARKTLAKEKVEIEAVAVDRLGRDEDEIEKILKSSLKKMTEERHVEVIWLLADNALINAKNIGSFWAGAVKKKKIPVIAPLEQFASPAIGVAVFTADPDYAQLGVQCANQIVDVVENGKPVGEIGFEPTISVKTTLNTKVAKKLGWEFKTEKLNRVNKIIAAGAAGKHGSSRVAFR
jgi:hypothetical protein